MNSINDCEAGIHGIFYCSRRAGALLTCCLAGIAGCLLLAGCCSHRPVSAVVVPEAIFRTEISATNRIRLPLAEPGRKSLTEFLAQDGDWSNRSGTPDPAVVRDARPVLETLATQPLTLSNLKAGNYLTLNYYFGKEYSRQIVDARNYDPHHPYNAQGEPEYAAFPLAFHHGHFWWLFYPDAEGNITGLMLVREIHRSQPTD